MFFFSSLSFPSKKPEICIFSRRLPIFKILAAQTETMSTTPKSPGPVGPPPCVPADFQLPPTASLGQGLSEALEALSAYERRLESHHPQTPAGLGMQMPSAPSPYAASQPWPWGLALHCFSTRSCTTPGVGPSAKDCLLSLSPLLLSLSLSPILSLLAHWHFLSSQSHAVCESLDSLSQKSMTKPLHTLSCHTGSDLSMLHVRLIHSFNSLPR